MNCSEYFKPVKWKTIRKELTAHTETHRATHTHTFRFGDENN